MPNAPVSDLTDLEQLLERLGEADDGREQVKLRQLVDAVGRRSFGPLLVVAGVVGVSPLSGIPGMPTTLGVFVMLLAGQLLMKREHFWLPRWVLERSIARTKLQKALRFMRRPARWIDRGLRPRLVALTAGPATYMIAVLCLLIAATMPPLELVPFAASTASAALTAFGLALIARDGVLAIVAFVFTAATGVLVGQALMGD